MKKRYLRKAEEIKSYQKQYRSTHNDAIRVKRRPYQRDVYLKSRVAPRLAAMLARGGSCERCGCDELSTLQFHHIDPTQKSFAVAAAFNARSHSKEEIQLEINKCELLCANCHAIEHCTWSDEEFAMMRQLCQQHFSELNKD